MIIRETEYFSKYRNRLIAGENPKYYLIKKLNNLGFVLDNDDEIFINEDTFYLLDHDIKRLIDNPNYDYRKIIDECDFYNAMGEIQTQINRYHLKNGVMFLNLRDSYIDEKVAIGKGCTIYPNSYLEGVCNIGENCIIGPESKITNSLVKESTTIIKSVVVDSLIGSNCNVGPYAYIRPESVIGNQVKIGDFVEIKKSIIGDKTKISHLAYIGDSEIGETCNIACGVITANYDGKNKYKTIIGDNSFIGCNVTMVSPVTIEHDSYIAAGSTITEDVKSYDLAIARERQINKKEWVKKKEYKRIEKE
ncbi:MAG: hypothetical protein KAG94_05055 [Clostridiales bacterium]|nr:hypothetical protein [Clostridiales bacterium]